MNRAKSKIIIVITALFIILSTVLSSAAPTIFTDVKGHWGEDFVEDVYQRNLITGYPDKTFKPDGNITKLETIVIISRLMGFSESEGQYYINQYDKQLESNKIPEWGQGPAAYALFNDILLEEELKTLISTSNQTYAKRYEVAIFIGRLLEYIAGEEMGKIYVLPYKDEMSIPAESKPYLDLLLRKGILDPASNEGKFLPNNQITRAEVAKLVSLSAEILDDLFDEDDIIIEPGPIVVPPPVAIVKETVKGKIDNVILGGALNIISIEIDSNRKAYTVAKEAKINIDGKSAKLDQLKKGQTVTVTVENNTATDIKATSTKETLEGYYLSGESSKIFIKDNKNNTHTLMLTPDSKIYFDNKAVSVDKLKSGDAVKVTYISNEILEIEAQAKEQYFEGVVRSKKDDKDDYYLEVLLKDGTLERFNINSKTSLRRDRKSARFEDIKVGDEVDITVEYGVIVYIDAFSVKRNVEGYIKKIVIGQKDEVSEIVVEKFDGTRETFEISLNSVIRVEKERAGIYDLKLNYEVELQIENEEVIWVEVYRKLQGSSYNGKVTYMDIRENYLEIETANREEVEIFVDNDTIYNDERGNIISLRDIYVGDEILAVVENNGYFNAATRIIVIIRR